jgi:sec-independent protein translocase protein TatA
MLGGWEWLVILGVLAIVMLWGPAKIPELAKSIGKAKGEFDKASKEYQKAAFETQITTTNATVTTANAPANSDESLFAAAKKYGIATEGKTREQISTELLTKI